MSKKHFLILFTILLAAFLLSPIVIFAQESKSIFNVGEPPKLQMPIPGTIEFSKIKVEGGTISVPWLAEYIAGIYKYAIALAVSLAIFMVMVGGFLWITAAGDKGKIGKATTIITDAVVGLILAVGSYVILYTINPDLLNFEAIRLQVVKADPWSVAETELNLNTGGFGAESYPEQGNVELTPVSGNTPAAKLSSICKPDPKSYEGRIANLRAVLPEWLAVCKKGCVYIKGGFTRNCSSTSGGKEMAKYMFAALKKNNLPLPPDCDAEGSEKNNTCWDPIAKYYHDEMAVPSCNAGMIIGDCLTWSRQLLECAGKTKFRIPQYRGGKAGFAAYLVFEANGIDDALTQINQKGGLKFGDIIWAETVGHNFMYIDTSGGQIVEMGGFGSGSVTVPGVGKLNNVKVHPLNDYLNIIRSREKADSKKEKPRGIKTYIARPYDF